MNDDILYRKGFPKILYASGNPASVVARLDLDPASTRIGVVGGKWTGAFTRAMIEKKLNAYIADKTAFADTSAIVGVGAENDMRRAALAAKKLNRPLYLVPTTCEAIPDLAMTPKAVVAFADAVSECDEETLRNAFCAIATLPTALCEKKAVAALYDIEGGVTLGKRAMGVVNETARRLADNEYGRKNAAAIVAEANLKLFALRTLFGSVTSSVDAISYLNEIAEIPHPFDENAPFNTREEKKFVIAIVFVRFCLSALACPEQHFLPPPSCNERLAMLSKLTGKSECELLPAFLQKDADPTPIEPRINEYSEDILALLRETDEINLKNLGILRRLRFDCGQGLKSALNPEKLSAAISLGAELCAPPSLLGMLRNRGELESLRKLAL